jgi:hypothetical protein
MADVDLNAPVTAAQAQKGQLDTLYANQDAQTNSYLKSYSDLINSQGTSQALANKIGNELNLPTLRSNANMLNTQMANLPSTYGAATRGFDVSQNALSRIIAQKSSELAPAQTTANNALSTAENNLSTRLGYAQSDWARQLQPLQEQGTLLSEKLTREATGYTTQMESELNAIIAKMNAGVTISEAEKNRANQLSIAEKSYQNALEVAKLKTTDTTSPYVTLGEGSTLYNTSTGQTYTAPKSYAASDGGW